MGKQSYVIKSPFSALLVGRPLSLVFLLIGNLTNGPRFHQFLGTKTTEANKSLKTDANGAH
jgi:hypothetical protein